MSRQDLYATSNEPRGGQPIYPSVIRALLRAARSQGIVDLPEVNDEYIYVPIVCDEELKVRWNVLCLTSYDEGLQAWFADSPNASGVDDNLALRKAYVVYEANDYAILIGQYPVRAALSGDALDIQSGDNCGADDTNKIVTSRSGLLSLTQALVDPQTSADYALVIREGSVIPDVRYTFTEYADASDETNLIGTCSVKSSTLPGLLDTTIKVKDPDGNSFAGEAEEALLGRSGWAKWVAYLDAGYVFWRWESYSFGCPD